MNEFVPDGWKRFSIKEIGTVVTGSTPPKKYPENYGGDLPWIKPPDLDNEMVVFNSSETISEIGRQKIRLLPKGTVLISCIGNIGKIAIAGHELCTNQQINSIIPNEKIVDSVFLYFTIRRMQPYMQKMASKAVVPLLNKTNFSNIIVNLPPLLTQKKIVAILEKAEKLKGWRREADELTDELLKSTFLEMFGDPVKNPKGWEKKRLKEFGEVKTGNTPSRKNPEYYGDYIEWIKSDNINTPYIYLTKSEEMLSEEGAKIGRIAPKGSVLVTCIAGSLSCIGNIGIADRDVGFNQQINAIIPNKEVNKLFLYHLILITKNYIQNYSTKSMKGMLSKSTFESIVYIFPPTPIQNEFGTLAKKIGLLKNNQNESKEQIDNLFNSLMQQAFRGELT